MSLPEVVRAVAGYRGQVTHVEHLPARPAQPGGLSAALPETLERYLAGRGIRLWSHQAETIEAVRSRQDAILTTATASGKTLAFNLSVFEQLANDADATALYLYPTKALANDQLAALTELDGATGIRARAAAYDGDTPQSRRASIRATSRAVITNPFGLHEYLPSHHLWERFFSGLAIVVVDEAHTYRGVLGANVSMVLRRLRRIAAHYGSDPRFVLASGTIANPAEHALALVGREHRVIDNDGAPRGPKDFVCWNSIANPDRSPHLQAADLLAHLAKHGHQAICFTVSRRMAELVARWAGEAAPGRGIVAYRAGYQPADRRRIEEDLRRGVLDAVAATTALEVGIDIGHLEAVVMAGYPGTICSMWQQAGRAGRGLGDSIAVLVAFEDPLDQYLVTHPDELFAKPHEQAVLDLANSHILAGHVMCAAAELPLRETDGAWFGPGLEAAEGALSDRGLLVQTPMGWAFHGTFRPAGAVSLNAVDDESVQLRCGDQLLEVMSSARALASAYPGAIVLHRGVSYRVEALDLEAGIAHAVIEESDNHTEVMGRTSVRVLEERRRRAAGRATLCLGEVRISQRFHGYRLKARDRVLGTHNLDLPAVEMDTVGLWLVLPPGPPGEVRPAQAAPPAPAAAPPTPAASSAFAGGLHAAEHALVHMMPLLAMCDRRDIGGMSNPAHPDAGGAAIFVFDAYPGGIGITERAYESFEDLAALTLELLRDCSCENGCPSCVYDRNCASDNHPIDRLAAVEVLQSTVSPRVR